MSRFLALLAGAVLVGCGAGGGGAGEAAMASAGGDPGAGATAIAKYGCGSCHVIPGIQRARGLVGPPLTDLAHRTYIAGKVSNTPTNLAAWIRLPDSVEPGTIMPTLGVSEQDAHDITAYLYLETATRHRGPPRLLPTSLLPHE